MTPEELSRVRKIYEEVLPMSGSAREAYIGLECRGDEGIRAEIERLLIFIEGHDTPQEESLIRGYVSGP